MSKTLKIVIWILVILLIVGIIYFVVTKVLKSFSTVQVSDATKASVQTQQNAIAESMGLSPGQFMKWQYDNLRPLKNKIVAKDDGTNSILQIVGDYAGPFRLFSQNTPDFLGFQIINSSYLIQEIENVGWAKFKIQLDPRAAGQQNLFTYENLELIGKNARVTSQDVLSKIPDANPISFSELITKLK
jgi:hypothetical protein